MTSDRDIGDRLQNWADWATSGDGGYRAASMTAAICDAMQKAHQGVLHGGEMIIRSIDTNDAVLVGRAMVKLTLDDRRIIGLHYIDGARSAYIAALLRFPAREFEQRMADAQRAVEAVLSKMSVNSNSQLFP